jgi:hypothetical protein
MQLGVYRTREALHKMKKIKANMCSACPLNIVGSLEHYLLYCPFVQEIHERFIPQLFCSNPKVSSLLENKATLMVTILDPESALLPNQYKMQLGLQYRYLRIVQCTMYITNLRNTTTNHPEHATTNLDLIAVYKF